MKVSRTVFVKKGFLCVVSCILTAVLLAFGDQMKAGVKNGLNLSLNILIPSLFLFTVLAIFIQLSGAAEPIGRVLSPVTRVVLGIEGRLCAIFILSALSGYPVGAKLLAEEYENGNIGRQKALKMLYWCVNAAPSFVLVAVAGFLGDRQSAQRLFLAHITASILIGVFIRFLPERKNSKRCCHEMHVVPKSSEMSLGDAFVLSVQSAGKTMLGVCLFAVLFSGVSGMLMASGLPEGIKNTVIELSEISIAAQGFKKSRLCEAAFLLGFGGLSVIFQVRMAAGRIRPSIGFLVLTRAFHGGVSAGLVSLFEWISPRTVETAAVIRPVTTVSTAGSHNGVFGGLAMMFLSVVVLSFFDGQEKHALKK